MQPGCHAAIHSARLAAGVTMRTLSLNRLLSGMVLAETVRDINGRRLFPAGHEVTESTLRILAMWGVTEVVVADDPSSAPTPGLTSGPTSGQTSHAYSTPSPAWTEVQRRFHGCDLENPHNRALAEELAARLEERSTCATAAHACPPCACPPPVDRPTLLELGTRLATLPETFHRLTEVLHDPMSTAADAAEIISYDPDLASRLLRFANSAYFGLRSPVDSINRAVIVIGVGQLMVIATGTCLMRSFRGIPSSIVDMRAFWRHSVACGVAARILAVHAGLDGTDRLFLSGLLHDIGRLVTFIHLPEHATCLLQTATTRKMRLVDLEKAIVGADHGEVGAALLTHWNCPAYLIDDQRAMHAPDIHERRHAILAAADALANLFGPGTSGERLMPRISTDTWRATGLAPTAFATAAAQLERQVDDLLQCMEAM